MLRKGVGKGVRGGVWTRKGTNTGIKEGEEGRRMRGMGGGSEGMA